MIKAAYQFLEYLQRVKGASEHTIRSYAIDLNALKNFLDKDLPEEKRPEKIHFNDGYDKRDTQHDYLLKLIEIDRRVLRLFLASLVEKKTQKRTVVRRLSSLRTFFKFCVRMQLLEHSPAEELESPKLEKRVPLSLTYDQVRRLFDQPDTDCYLGFRDRCIMELFYSSGLRVSELVALNRTDLDDKSLLVRLRGKGKKERLIPITKNAADWISAYLEHPERHKEIDGHLAQADALA